MVVMYAIQNMTVIFIDFASVRAMTELQDRLQANPLMKTFFPIYFYSTLRFMHIRLLM